MKTTKLIILTMALGLMGLMTAGCSKSNSQSNNNGATGGTTAIIIDPNAPTSTNTTPTFSGGSTLTFTPVSTSVMNTYVATHPLNAPSNYRVNINLVHVEAGRYAGKILISYIDNGVQNTGEFTSGTGRNGTSSGNYDNNTLESEYNYWFTLGGRKVFTAQFEDSYGAIVVALEPVSSASSGNDAEPITNVPYKGSIYFKNFTSQRVDTYWFQSAGGSPLGPHGPYRACWFIYNGPYDCRTSTIQQKTALAPGAGAGYTLLGTFTGVDIKTGFNIN
ncbi:MAG: hypothetical protein H7328_11055 [Bdellovibrio sp.]|nr:hypothetical protein [Bdellovibrio sp.]